MSAERNGGDHPGSALFSQWMSAFGQANPALKAWEGWFSEQVDRFVRSDAFLGQIGKAMENSFLMKSQVDRVMEQSLRRMRLPTTSDLDAVHKRLDVLERQLDRVVERLDALQPAPAKPAARKRSTSARSSKSAAAEKPAAKKPAAQTES